MVRLSTAVLITLVLAVAGSAKASSSIAVASARVIKASIVSTDPLVKQLSVSANDLRQGYISLQGAPVTTGSVRIEIPSMLVNTIFSGEAAAISSRITLTGTEASLRQNPFAYITYDGQ